METVMDEQKRVKKVGMKDIQRDGWEYELTVSLNIDRDTHMAIASKDRTGLFEGKDPFIITPATGKAVRTWCESGVDDRKEPTQLQFSQIIARKREPGIIDKAKQAYLLTEEQIKELTI